MMKRTIKFRGWNPKNKCWLYGFYLKNRGQHFIAEEGIQPPGKTWQDFEVLPDTVGQFTGLKDKDGVELYEGDIVDVWSQGSHCLDGIIRWGAGRCGFFIGNSTNSIVWNLAGDQSGCETLKIIGNIHEQTIASSRLEIKE